MTTATTHVVDIQDRRKESRQAKNAMSVSLEALEIAMAVVGVEVGEATKIVIRVKDGDTGKQGSTRQIGPDAFLIKVYVRKQPAYTDAMHYAINNSVVHELRHVAQMQADADHALKYALATKAVGYRDNPYEVDARAFGRLAWHGDPAAKPTTAGKPMGFLLWGVAFGAGA